MTATTSKLSKTPALVGASIGLVAFLAAALLPSLLYGGYAGVMLAAAIFGAPVGPGGAAGALIVAGMVLAVVVVGALFALAGAAAGAAVGALVHAGAVEKAKAGAGR